jgi:hypothetical protein
MRRAIGVLALWLAMTARVHAQTSPQRPSPADQSPADETDEPTFGASARVSRIGVDAIDPSASATTISLTDRPRALETMDEILREAPGARARRTSSYGGFSTLSLRGADAEHTAVMIGDLPLVAADGSAVDLSTLPPWMFERLEVYRGGAPLWLGSGAIGGVVRLVPRDGRTRRLELAAGLGSFDRYQGRAAVSVGDDRLRATVGAGLVSVRGDFPYRDDGGTAFDPSDDRDRGRQNAQLLEGTGLVHLSARALDGRFTLLATGLERAGGLAPPPSRFVDVPSGRRASQRFTLGASMDWLEGGRELDRAAEARWRISTAIGAGFEERRVSDPLAQFGQVPREATDDLSRVHARVAGSIAIEDWLALTAIAQYAHEEITSSDRLIARVSPEHLAAAVAQAKFSDPRAERWLIETLLARRQRIFEEVFTKSSPLDEFQLVRRTPGSPTQSLCFEDLAVKFGVVDPTKVVYKMRMMGGATLEDRLGWHQFAPDEAHPQRACVVLPVGFKRPSDLVPADAPDDHPLRYGVLRIYVHQAFTFLPASQIDLHFYDRGRERGFALVGIERPERPRVPSDY